MNTETNQIAVRLKLKEKKEKAITVSAVCALIIVIAAAAIAIKISGTGKEVELNATLGSYKTAGEPASVSFNPHPYYNVSITADGMTYSVRSTGTVADALSDAGVRVGDNDLINVGLGEKLNGATSVVINRVEYVEEVKLDVIEYATKYTEDDDYVIGYQKVVVDGEEGELETVVRHKYIDGKLTESNVISTEVTEEPVDEVIVMGTSEINPIQEKSISRLDVPDWLTLDENGAPTSYTQVLTGKGVAYSAKPTAKTASGRTVKVGYVAVNPKIIPYGTELYIASTDNKHIYGYAIAADTGTSCMKNEILVDLFMATFDDCCQWGAHQVNVYVLN